MKILLNSIGQTLQKHGPGLTDTNTYTRTQNGGGESGFERLEGHMWMQCGVQLANGRRNKRPKIALPFLRAICFAEILWKFFERRTGCHVGDIWPNCTLMCVRVFECVCVCERVCADATAVWAKWLTATGHKCFIFLFACVMRWFLIVSHFI